MFALVAEAGELRVCADPDALPYSHADQSGFENRIARLAAEELGAELVYYWHPQEIGFVRKTVGAGLCDLWMGVPSGYERLATTRPYYRSSYVFVFRHDNRLTSFDDPRLRSLRIGVQLPGNDLAATPPGHALAERGAIDNVVGFPVRGARHSGQRIVEAIARGELDAGVVWGPAAGFFSAREKLEIARAPFDFAIAIGVKHGEKALREALDDVVVRRREDIERILDAYAVPRLP